MGVASVGSIHQTGGISIPVSRLPEEFTVSEVIRASFDKEAEVKSYDNRIRSKWIALVGGNPHILFEERKWDSFELLERTFEEHGWIPPTYVKAGAEAFMTRYCW